MTATSEELLQALTEWAMEDHTAFQAVRNKSVSPREIGEAFREIRNRRLYRETADDFYVYCARRWGMLPERINWYLAQAEMEIESEQPPPLQQKEKREGYIYFLLADDLVKIGHTTNLKMRIQAIQSMSPVPVVLLGVIDGTPREEKALHRQFRTLRDHGEWFRFGDNLKVFVQERLQ